MTKTMPRSISSFAEELLLNDMKQIHEGSLPYPNVEAPQASPDPEQRDISTVKVTDAFRKELLGESYVPEMDISEIPAIPFDFTGEKEKVNPELSPEDLLTQFNELLHDARRVLSEMTSVGMLGVNMAGPTTRKKKKRRSSKRKCVEHIKAKSKK